MSYTNPELSSLKKIKTRIDNSLRGIYQSSNTGKLKGRLEHTYDFDSAKGHKLAKRFGGAGYYGKLPYPRHILDLKKNRQDAMGSAKTKALDRMRNKENK